MTQTEMWTGRLATSCKLLFLALLLHPGGEGAVTATPNFKVIGSTYARAGGKATLTCQVEPHQSSSSFKWARNAKVIPGQTDQTLRLQNVTKQDAGYYQCGTNESDIEGEGRCLHVFTVGDPLPAPVVKHSTVPVCGRSLSLECLFLRDYIPSVNTVYTWYMDDREIKGQTGPTLYFTKLVETDAGSYSCSAWEGYENTTSPTSSIFHLAPLASPKVSINKLPPGVHVKGVLGGNLTLNCEASSVLLHVPNDGYTWSFSRSPDAQNLSLDGNGSSLFLGPLITDLSGQYFCEARTNRIFRNLTLAGHAYVTVDVVYLANIKLTSNQEVNEGDLVTLTCRVDSHPTARLFWIVNGREVRHVTDNLDHYVISSAACSDSNNYTCGASNPDLPDLYDTVQLTVLCKQEDPATASTVPNLAESKDEGKPLSSILPATLGTLLLVALGVILLLKFCRKVCPGQNGQCCGCCRPKVAIRALQEAGPMLEGKGEGRETFELSPLTPISL